ncbi:MAG: hypothetical protein ACREC5_00255 [Thermoplasmata archaeon]
MTKCPGCAKGEMLSVDDIRSEIEGLALVPRGHRCSNCGEELIHGSHRNRTIKITRR